ncbi:hypothetical protein AgCh_039170 [Apium graveolens]
MFKEEIEQNEERGMNRYSVEELLPVAYLQERRCPWSETSRVNGCPRWETLEYPALCTQKFGIICPGDALSVKSRSRGQALGLCSWTSSADIPKASRRRFPVGFPLGLGIRNLNPLVPVGNISAKLVREAAAKTNDLDGKGTTTSAVFAQGLIAEGSCSLANPVFITRGIEKQ